MTDTAPAAPSGAVKPSAPTETILATLPVGTKGPFNEVIHEIRFETERVYSDGPNLKGYATIQLDQNGQSVYRDLIIKHSADITTIGQTTLWTPSTGKGIRLLGFSIVVDPATTTVAGSVLTMQDGSTDIDDFLILGITAPAVPLRWQCPLPMNGVKLPAGDVLNVNLSAALSAGRVRVNSWGYEE